MNKLQTNYSELISQITNLVQQARQQTIKSINTTMVVTYRNIGKYIIEYEQWGADRAEYWEELIKNMATDLTQRIWKWFSYRSIQRYKQFFLSFPNYANSVGTIPNVGRSQITRILHLKDSQEQQFFLVESAKQGRSIRELDRQINSALYHRIALSKNKEWVMKLAKEWEVLGTPSDLVRDSYILEFLGLHQNSCYTEKDLETAIINNLQMFLLEIGKWFSFVARQQRIRADIHDYYIDLVFYNRLLQCHLLIDLKIGTLTHQDIGQMQMYVNYYNQEIKLENEKPTIWLILCREKDNIVLKYTVSPDQEQIFAKEYQLYLPKKEELQSYLNSHLGTLKDQE